MEYFSISLFFTMCYISLTLVCFFYKYKQTEFMPCFILQDVQIDRMYLFKGNSGIRLTLLSVLFLAHYSLDYTRQTLFWFKTFTFSFFFQFKIIIPTFSEKSIILWRMDSEENMLAAQMAAPSS